MTTLKGFNTIKKRLPFNLFFIELLIVLMFFSVSGAVIMNLFASADIVSRKNRTAEQLMLRVQSVSEMYAAKGDMYEAADAVFGRGACVECTKTVEPDDIEAEDAETKVLNGLSVIYDENLMPLVTPEGRRDYGVIELIMFESRDKMPGGDLRKLEITAMVVYKDYGTDVLYEVASTKYVPDYEAEEEEKLTDENEE